MIFYRPRTLIYAAIAILVCALILTGLALAGEKVADVETVALPGWLWAALVSGVVQGAIWFGAVNQRFTALFERLEQLAKRQADDHKVVNNRIDQILLQDRRRRGGDIPVNSD